MRILPANAVTFQQISVQTYDGIVLQPLSYNAHTKVLEAGTIRLTSEFAGAAASVLQNEVILYDEESFADASVEQLRADDAVKFKVLRDKRTHSEKACQIVITRYAAAEKRLPGVIVHVSDVAPRHGLVRIAGTTIDVRFFFSQCKNMDAEAIKPNVPVSLNV